MEVTREPGAVYDVYIKVGRPGTSEIERLVGSFNLFGIGHGEHGPWKTTCKTDITDMVRAKLIDPTIAGDAVFRARYATPNVRVKVTSVRIEAR